MTKKSKSAKQEPVKPSKDIVGTWIREERDEAPYPDQLTFEADGIYRGKKAPGESHREQAGRRSLRPDRRELDPDVDGDRP
jgi:hypothetical protein